MNVGSLYYMSQQQQEIYYNDMAKNIRNPAQPCTGSSNSNEEYCHGHMDARLQNPQNLEPAVHHSGTPHGLGSEPATDNFEEQAGLGCGQGSPGLGCRQGVS